MSKALMIAGTGSGAGKSAIAAGLCRIFRDMGLKVAPFKAQNMALNSYITIEGGEIGRAQAFQAEAAGIEPCNDMNPVLLKATGEAGSQVIFNGRVFQTMTAEEYYAMKDKTWEVVRSAYDRLADKYELIIMEGAGSPAEINLLDSDIVNMRMARYAEAPVVLVGDIDRGGMFASLYGTVELLKNSKFKIQNSKMVEETRDDADYIKAFIVNKFRGNIDILRPGLRMLEKKTGKPFIGVIPWQDRIGLDEEDGLSIDKIARFSSDGSERPLKVVVLRLRRISNFTDFTPFLYEPDVDFKFTLWEEDILNADLILIPGTKSTMHDLMFLRERGIDRALKAAAKNGTMIAGICGGYQMLGKRIFDPHSVESSMNEVDGLGLLDTETILTGIKTTCRVSARIESAAWFDTVQGTSNCRWNNMKGYEIHMGDTTGDVGLFALQRCYLNSGLSTPDSNFIPDGSIKDNVWGTYIHGIFDNDGLRTSVINALRMKKGLEPRQDITRYSLIREQAIDSWARLLRSKVDICFLLRQLGLEQYQKSYCSMSFRVNETQR